MDRTKHLAQLSKAVVTSSDLEGVLNYALQLLIDDFGYDYAGAYLLDRSTTDTGSEEDLTTARLSRSVKNNTLPLGYEADEIAIRFDSSQPGRSLVARAISANHAQLGPPQIPPGGSPAEDYTQAVVPISTGDRTFGALTTLLGNKSQQGIARSSGETASYSTARMAEMHLLANMIAIGIERLRTQREEPPKFQPKPIEPKPPVDVENETDLKMPDSDRGTHRRLAELRTLWTISQAISLDTGITSLYMSIHEQVLKVMGEFSSFAIALYDANTEQICIPYMVEDDKSVDIPPFPLGEGLSSIVIRSRRPLMLVEDSETKARTLGAKVVGEPAKSWLGVPMLYGGEPIGVIIAQDLVHEHRFTEEDQRFLSTIASQIAVVVRNVRLLETSRRQMEFEKLVNEITLKISRATNFESILKTTVEELGSALGARRAQINIDTDTLERGYVISEDKGEAVIAPR